MKHQKLFDLFCLIFIALLLAACGGVSASTVSPTDTPVPSTTTPTPAPPTATPTSEPPPATGGVLTIDALEVGNPERGREIFETGGGVLSSSYCAKCHSLDDSTLDNPYAGPPLQGISERASDRVSALSAEEYLRQSIIDPAAFVVEDYSNLMPNSYKLVLSEEDIDALVAFMLTQ